MVFKAHTAPRVREPHPGGGRVQGAPAQRTGRPPPLPIPAHSQHSTPRDTSTEPPPSCNNSGASAPPRCRGQLLRFYILWYYVAELPFLPMEVGNMVRTRGVGTLTQCLGLGSSGKAPGVGPPWGSWGLSVVPILSLELLVMRINTVSSLPVHPGFFLFFCFFPFLLPPGTGNVYFTPTRPCPALSPRRSWSWRE